MSKSCRYGHGELIQIEGIWSLSCMEKEERENPAFPDKKSISHTPNGVIYTMHVYRCPVCGYLELFDDLAEYEH